MRKIQDGYFKEAKRLGYSARSVFKLEEMAKKFGLGRGVRRVLDLGAYPGSWGEYMAREWGIAEVVAVDIRIPEISKSRKVRWVKKNLLELEFGDLGGKFDLVLSDALAGTSGSGDLDHQVSLELSWKVLEVASWVLKGSGGWVCKIFGGEDLRDFVEEARVYFERFKLYKPRSCRSASRELYLIGLGFRGKGVWKGVWKGGCKEWKE